MGDDVRAMVLTGAERLELQRFERPEIGENDGLLRVEACGICGTDSETLSGAIPLRYPVIPGHEPVGLIEEIGPRAALRWGLEPGDRVVVQSDFGCGRCRGCMDQQACNVSPGTYGFMPTGVAPALWGGYAEMMYLAPGAVPHKISKSVEPRIAALYNPLGAGFAWAVSAPGLQFGDTIAVLGSGQRGLACVIAASAAGAARIFVTGLGSRDAHKLALAAELGADVVMDVEQEDALERITAETHGRGVDIVVDTTPHATQPVIDAVQMARPGGTIVLAGLKGGGIPNFPSDEVAMRYQTIKGVRAVDYHSFQRAVRLIESGRVPIHEFHTHHYPLEAAADAVRALNSPDERPVIAVTVEP
ncbi:MAG: zinc-binding dehydrogenase [Deltaproteobacteria bacterium]|nr:zinc-binding dehydrogenase [Deltaproteobacteria bacterium]MBW2362654.1 zinc-binding dehydrogenase [Deltaproteobacteria bacterium]